MTHVHSNIIINLKVIIAKRPLKEGAFRVLVKRVAVLLIVIGLVVSGMCAVAEIPNFQQIGSFMGDDAKFVEEYSGWIQKDSGYDYVLAFEEEEGLDEHRYVFNDDMTILKSYAWNMRCESWDEYIQRFDSVESEITSEYGTPTLSFAEPIQIETDSSLLNGYYNMSNTIDPEWGADIKFHKYNCWETGLGLNIEMMLYCIERGENAQRGVVFPTFTTCSVVVRYDKGNNEVETVENDSSDEEYIEITKDAVYTVDGVSEFSFDIARVTGRMISIHPDEKYSAEIMLPTGKKAVDIVFKYKNLRNTTVNMGSIVSGKMIYNGSYEYEAEMRFESLGKGNFMGEITPLAEEYLHVYFVVPEDVWQNISGTIQFEVNIDGVLLQGALDDLL